MLKKIMRWIKKPQLILINLLIKTPIYISDRIYVKIMYRLIMNKHLNLNNPKTFNEKLQWLKLNDRRKEYTKMVDKYVAKEYIENIIGKEYIIPTIGIYNSFEEIDFNKLPEQFVLKCTHDSGRVVICKNKHELDLKQVKRKVRKSLERNYYRI